MDRSPHLDDRTLPAPVALPPESLRDAIEAVRSAGPSALRGEFLPHAAEPNYLPNLIAIAKADLKELGPRSGERRLADYRREFPILWSDVDARWILDSVEHGESEPPHTPPPQSVLRADWLEAGGKTLATPIVFHTSTPAAEAVTATLRANALPEEIAAELGFSDLIELGHGGFGVVYAARQPGVGNRLVVIKYTKIPSREPQVLAALQHPNIMPVWSVHECNGHRVFCMPLHGKHTLADVLKQIDRTKSLPATGADFLSTVSMPADRFSPEQLRALAALPQIEEMAPLIDTERQRLEKLSYVESVVQGMTKLADALAHAHRRRVIHLDIKPANILITDEGVFMILDFGLAYQNGVPPTTDGGGTLRYMAPEQLHAFLNSEAVRPDPRMDLYSLGLVFFEMLTGRYPFAESRVVNLARNTLIESRKKIAPRVRSFNPSVSVDVDSIIGKLLHPDRELRYLSSEHLLADLQRHLQDLPLLYAANPSWRERISKFRRRHPVFTIALMAGFLAFAAIGSLGFAFEQTKQAKARTIEAETSNAEVLADRFAAEQTAIRIDAGSLSSPAHRAAAIARISDWRERYGVNADGSWRAGSNYARLPADAQRRLDDGFVEQALLAGHAERLNALGQSQPNRIAALERAVEWNLRAEGAANSGITTAIREQRLDLARLLERPRPPVPFVDSPDDNVDLYLRGLAKIAEDDYASAGDVFETLVQRDPHHAAGQFALGVANQQLGRFNRAIAQYGIAKALANTDPRAALNRGGLLIFYGQYRESLDDFAIALERDPNREEAHYCRAHSLFMLKEFRPALAALDRADEIGPKSYRNRTLRYWIFNALKDENAAASEKKELDRIEPETEADFIARGCQKNGTKDFEGALADFRRAAEINPHSVHAWKNLAAVQTRLNRIGAASESLAVLLRVIPYYTAAKFERAVLLARLGQWDDATALIKGIQPENYDMWYQQACVYSLGATVNLKYRDEAFRCLKNAIQSGFKDWKYLEADADLANIKDLPQVRKFIETKGKAEE